MSRMLAGLLSLLLVGGLNSGTGPSRAPVGTPTSEEAVPRGIWELQAIVYADGGEAVPADPAKYTIAFFPGERSVTYSDDRPAPFGEPDGVIGLQLDCNVGSADYRVDGRRLTIISVLSTDAGCFPPTLGEEFKDRLRVTTSYALNGDELVFFLANGGGMRFARPGAGTPSLSGIADLPMRGVVPANCPDHLLAQPDLNARLSFLGDGPIATPSAMTITVPLGREASRDTVAAIAETVSRYLGCLNAGDLLRASAFLTDNGVRRIFSYEATLYRDRPPALATPAVLSSQERTRLIALTDIVILADGRAAAIALLRDPLTLPRGPQAVLLYFVWNGDQWLVDDVIGFSTPAPPATPAAASPTS